jgi:hypothetical protein
MLADLFNKRNKKDKKEEVLPLAQLFREPATKVERPVIKPRSDPTT